MKKSILYILFALFSLSAAVSLTACKDDGVEISGANKSKTPKNVKLLEYGPTSLTICWDFIRGATSYTVQLVDGEMNPVSEALCKTTDAIDYHEFTDLATGYTTAASGPTSPTPPPRTGYTSRQTSSRPC